MSKFSKKLISATLTATTTVWLSGAALFVPVAVAQTTTADLQAQIAALLAQIQQLQAQLAGQSGGSSYNYTRDLTVGSRGDDVTALQGVLNAKGHLAVAATGYFGSLTKAALAKWQASAGISPAAGYFGPKSRAAFNAMAGGGGGVAVPPPAGGGVGVSLASDSPSGSAISGAGQIDVGKYRLSGAGTITGLTFKKVGVVSDSSINNLYLADESGAIIAQYSSLSGGVATFSGLNVSVSGSKTLTLRMDLSTTATAGNTIAWSLETVTGASASGLPSKSNTLTVTTVSNPDIASVTWDFNAVGSSVDAGTNSVLIGSASVNVSNSAVWLKSLKYTLVGSASMSDIRNLKLLVNGVQVGSTLAQASGNGNAVFDVSAANLKLSTGNTTVELYADIAGSPNRDVTVRLLRPYDIHLVDSQYNAGISLKTLTDDSTKVSINKGQITVSLASDTPTGNIPLAASNITLAKFTIYAAGEPVKVKYVDYKITGGGVSDWATVANVTDNLENLALVDDAGGQVGNSISTITSGTTNGTCTLAAGNIACHLGTSSSFINYIVPANTTRVLSLKVNTKNGTNNPTSLKGELVAATDNLEGQVSFQSASSGGVSGATLTVATTPVTVAKNGGFGNPTYVGGAQNQKIASFVFTASSAEGVKISTLTFDKDSQAALDLQNLKVMVGSTQFGTTRATVADEETSLSFSASSPATVPAGGSLVVDVYADILSSSATTTSAGYAAAIDYKSLTAVGAVSNSSITAPAAADGQDVIVSAGAVLTLGLDNSNNPSAKQVVMGSSDNLLFAYRFTNDNVEDVKVTDIRTLDTITNGTSGKTSFTGWSLYDITSGIGSKAQVGSQVVPTIAGSASSTATFSFSTPLVIPKNSTKLYGLYGNVTSFTNGGVSNSGHDFQVTSTDVTAIGKDSNNTVTLTTSADGNVNSVFRSKLTYAKSVIGAATSRGRSSDDRFLNLDWAANAANDVTLTSVSIRFSGLAISGVSSFTASLVKDGSNDGLSSNYTVAQTCTVTGNSCTVAWGAAVLIPAGTSLLSDVKIDSSSFANLTGEDAVTVSINAASNVVWNDGTTSSIPLDGTGPFVLADIGYN